MKLCVVGCGHISAMHGPAFARCAVEEPSLELAACCDPDLARADAFAGRYGFARRYADMEQMLAQERPDAAVLLTPVSLTARLSVELIRRRIPVLLEKPPGLNTAETEQIIRAAQKTGTPHMVAFNRRHMPLVRRLRELTAGERVCFAEYAFYRVNRLDADFSTTAIHGVDTVRFLCRSDYRRVRFTYQPAGELGATNIFLDCEMESGALARLSFLPCTGVLAERATLHVENKLYYAALPVSGSVDGDGLLLRAENGRVEKWPGEAQSEAEAGGFYGENRAFLQCVRAGIQPEDDAQSGLQAVEIADCIRRRAEEYRA